MGAPTASVIIATLNEQDTIAHVVSTALACPEVVEVIIADGGSTDATTQQVASLAARDARVRLISNPEGRQSVGLNRAASVARGDLLVRMDAHTRYADDYIAASIAAWRRGIAVGGPMVAQGANAWGHAIANAMADPLAIGPGRFHHAAAVEQVDTVYLGTFARAAFLELGGYRTFPSGTVEDADFYARWRASGGVVVVDPSIRSWYRPRSTWSSLTRQFFKYGRGKAELLRLNGRLPTMRPLAPFLLVLALVTGIGVLPWTWLPLAAVLTGWLVGLVVVAMRAPGNRLRTSIAAATMHLAFGSGMWAGLFARRPAPETRGLAETPPRSAHHPDGNRRR
ncbi:MAG: glycosyltransferase [Acidimicrobiia bacterium]